MLHLLRKTTKKTRGFASKSKKPSDTDQHESTQLNTRSGGSILVLRNRVKAISPRVMRTSSLRWQTSQFMIGRRDKRRKFAKTQKKKDADFLLLIGRSEKKKLRGQNPRSQGARRVDFSGEMRGGDRESVVDLALNAKALSFL